MCGFLLPASHFWQVSCAVRLVGRGGEDEEEYERKGGKTEDEMDFLEGWSGWVEEFRYADLSLIL